MKVPMDERANQPSACSTVPIYDGRCQRIGTIIRSHKYVTELGVRVIQNPLNSVYSIFVTTLLSRVQQVLL